MIRLKQQTNNNENYYDKDYYTYPEDEEKFNSYKNYVAEASAGYFITENKGHDKLFKEALQNKTDFIEFIRELKK